MKHHSILTVLIFVKGGGKGVVRGEAIHQLLSPDKLNNLLLELGFQFISK